MRDARGRSLDFVLSPPHALRVDLVERPGDKHVRVRRNTEPGALRPFGRRPAVRETKLSIE
jgi:hypothetical protein